MPISYDGTLLDHLARHMVYLLMLAAAADIVVVVIVVGAVIVTVVIVPIAVVALAFMFVPPSCPFVAMAGCCLLLCLCC